MEQDEWDRWEREDALAGARGCLSMMVAGLIIWAAIFIVLTQFGILF